jgi:hypothetical protein
VRGVVFGAVAARLRAAGFALTGLSMAEASAAGCELIRAQPLTASRWMVSTLTATILERRASVGPEAALQRRPIELVEAKVAVPTIVSGLVSFCGLSVNVALSSVAPAASRVHVIWVTAAPLLVKPTVLAVIEYEPIATLAIVATVVSDVASVWLPSR